MQLEVYLTTQDALAKLKELECNNNNEPLDIVLAPPEVSIASDEEDLDEINLTEGGTDLPGASGKITVLITVLWRLCLQQKNIVRKDVKNIMVRCGAVITQSSLLFQPIKI